MADALRADIRNGRYSPGEQLPSQRQLAAQYGVAQNTAGGAVKILQSEGLLDNPVKARPRVRTLHHVGRIEHINNPEAPRPTAIVPATTAFIQDDSARVLLIQRSDNGLWALPGGEQDFGESIAEAAVRETKEETGVDVEVIGLVGIYTDPRHLVEYSDGEVRQQFSICFRCRPIDGTPTRSCESVDVRWIDHNEVNPLSINPSMRLRIEHGFQHRPEPYIG